jgi:hypothetical protein
MAQMDADAPNRRLYLRSSALSAVKIHGGQTFLGEKVLDCGHENPRDRQRFQRLALRSSPDAFVVFRISHFHPRQHS